MSTVVRMECFCRSIRFKAGNVRSRVSRPDAESRAAGRLKLRQLLHCPEQVARLRQNRILENRLISDERVSRCHALHRSIEMMKELVGDSRGDLRAVSPA